MGDQEKSDGLTEPVALQKQCVTVAVLRVQTGQTIIITKLRGIIRLPVPWKIKTVLRISNWPGKLDTHHVWIPKTAWVDRPHRIIWYSNLDHLNISQISQNQREKSITHVTPNRKLSNDGYFIIMSTKKLFLGEISETLLALFGS